MRSCIVTALAVTAIASSAGGNSVTVDPDAFADGTVISNAFPNVTLTAEGDNLVNGDVLAGEWAFASTGSNVFAHTSTSYFPDEPLKWGNGYNNWLRVDFAVAVTSVSMDFIADDPSDQNAVLRAFDAAGSVVDTTASVGTYSTGEFVTLTVSAPGIAYVRAEPDLQGGSAWRLDHLTYSTSGVIPEPVTLLGTLLGVAAAAGCRWRRWA